MTRKAENALAPDGSFALASLKHERFSALCASGSTKSSAYLAVYGQVKTPAQAGSNLSKRPEVAARIKYLRFKHAEELSAIDADEPFAGFEQSILDVLGCMDELVELCVHHGLYADASQIRSGILTSTTRTLTHIEAIKALDRSAGVIVDDEMTDVAVRVLTTRCACE